MLISVFFKNFSISSSFKDSKELDGLQTAVRATKECRGIIVNSVQCEVIMHELDYRRVRGYLEPHSICNFGNGITERFHGVRRRDVDFIEEKFSSSVVREIDKMRGITRFVNDITADSKGRNSCVDAGTPR